MEGNVGTGEFLLFLMEKILHVLMLIVNNPVKKEIC